MSTPLYPQTCQPECKDREGNKGLWFDRFYDQYEDTTWKILKPEHNDEEKGNSYWLTKHFHNKQAGNDQQLAHHANQQTSLAEALQGKSIIFTSDWHMVTGMGNPHPVENGFAWHPTLGVPYLTGAAVKGIVRNYIENFLYDDDLNEGDNKKARKALLFNWFGSTDKNPASEGYNTQTGNLIFFDALPIKPVTLVVDIMTPHMGDWYQKGADKPNDAETVPADWHDPVPVTFLACNKISLQFSFALRQYPEDITTNSSKDAVQRDTIELSDVQEVLTSALQHLGAGGKTSTGYGAMQRDNKAEKSIQEEVKNQQEAIALQNLSKEALALHKLQKLLDNDKERGFKQAGSQASNDLISLLNQANSWNKDDQIKLADLAEAIYNWHGWGPKKKRPQKQKTLDKLRQST